MLIDVSRVVMSPALAQEFIVNRIGGHWLGGEFIADDKPQQIPMYGTVVPASVKDIDQLPEGDRVKGMMCFYSTQEIFVTRDEDDEPGISDQAEWRGAQYRIYQVLPMVDYGYYQAIGARMSGR